MTGDIPILHEIGVKRVGKAAAAIGAAFCIGIWVGVNYTAKLVLSSGLVVNTSWASTAEAMLYIVLAGFAICAGGWIILDVRERDKQ